MNDEPHVDAYSDVEELERRIDEIYDTEEPRTVILLMIQNAPRRIERELRETARSGNNWIACMRTDLNNISGFLQLREVANTIDDNLYKTVQGRVVELLKDLERYQTVPEPPKEELLEKLRHLID